MDKPISLPPEVRQTSIGGQALIEGLMMIGPEKTAMTVRLPDGTLHREEKPTKNGKLVIFLSWRISQVNWSTSVGMKRCCVRLNLANLKKTGVEIALKTRSKSIE